MTHLTSSELVNRARHNYSMYVLRDRAFPSIIDGMASGGRRIMWIARSGAKQKSATLAGAAMPLHPHAEATSTVDTLAKVYGNNVPLLKGYGSFGTRLKPGATGAPRYTTVAASDFSMDVLFRDIEIVPMIPNYDDTIEEPKHFLPLIPIVLLNPTMGIGVGFANDIMPRALKDIVSDQIKHLQGKKITEPPIRFLPLDAVSVDRTIAKNGRVKWHFEGKLEVIDTTTLRITNIPYGVSHQKIVEEVLPKLVDDGLIVNFIDDSASDIHIDVKFKRGQITSMTPDQLIAMLGLKSSSVENMNIVDYSGDKLIVDTNYCAVVKSFTDWRVQWYVQRFERLRDIITRDIQRHRDVLVAIKKNAGGVAKTTESRAAFCEWLGDQGIVHIDYVASLPVYRFTQAEADIIRAKLEEALKTLAMYEDYLKHPAKRTELYIAELKEVLKKHG